MESINQSLSATVDLMIRDMRVTRNMDEDSKQDPFMKLMQFKLTNAQWISKDKKYAHYFEQKPIFSM
jgi:hypothetical protein